MQNRYMKIIQASIVSLAFLALAWQPVNDPDFGWHLKSGMYYLDHWSVPDRDIFSWTAPNYPWVNHEYVADAVYALLYRLANNTTILLSLLFASLAVYLFLELLPKLCIARPDWKQRFLVGLPAFLIAKPFFGVRSQVFDWLAVVLLLFVWQKYATTGNKKILWAFPLLFLVWANIHAGFPLGLFMLAGLMFLELIHTVQPSSFPALRTLPARLIREQRKTIAFFIAILATSFLATLLTAYHYHLSIDFFNTSQGKETFQYIIEWAASTIRISGAMPFFCYLFFLIFLLMTEREQQPLDTRDALLFIFFLFAAFSYVRFIPIFAIVTLPIVYRRFAHHTFVPECLAFIVMGGFIISQFPAPARLKPVPANPIRQTSFVSSPFDAHQKAFYRDIPINALAWLKANQRALPPRMFNDYAWGGEIIWQLPDQPVFIDGRMPHWKLNGRSLLRDYITIDRVLPGWYETIRHYDIQWFFISSQSSLAATLEQLPDQWEKRYQDDQAVVFVKKAP